MLGVEMDPMRQLMVDKQDSMGASEKLKAILISAKGLISSDHKWWLDKKRRGPH
jgi:hypothetical protein